MKTIDYYINEVGPDAWDVKSYIETDDRPTGDNRFVARLSTELEAANYVAVLYERNKLRTKLTDIQKWLASSHYLDQERQAARARSEQDILSQIDSLLTATDPGRD